MIRLVAFGLKNELFGIVSTWKVLMHWRKFILIRWRINSLPKIKDNLCLLTVKPYQFHSSELKRLREVLRKI